MTVTLNNVTEREKGRGRESERFCSDVFRLTGDEPYIQCMYVCRERYIKRKIGGNERIRLSEDDQERVREK